MLCGTQIDSGLCDLLTHLRTRTIVFLLPDRAATGEHSRLVSWKTSRVHTSYKQEPPGKRWLCRKALRSQTHSVTALHICNAKINNSPLSWKCVFIAMELSNHTAKAHITIFPSRLLPKKLELTRASAAMYQICVQ